MADQDWRTFRVAGEVWIAQRVNSSPPVEVKGTLEELPWLIDQAERRKQETGSYWPPEMRLLNS